MFHFPLANSPQLRTQRPHQNPHHFSPWGVTALCQHSREVPPSGLKYRTISYPPTEVTIIIDVHPFFVELLETEVLRWRGVPGYIYFQGPHPLDWCYCPGPPRPSYCMNLWSCWKCWPHQLVTHARPPMAPVTPTDGVTSPYCPPLLLSQESSLYHYEDGCWCTIPGISSLLNVSLP